MPMMPPMGRNMRGRGGWGMNRNPMMRGGGMGPMGPRMNMGMGRGPMGPMGMRRPPIPEQPKHTIDDIKGNPQ